MRSIFLFVLTAFALSGPLQAASIWNVSGEREFFLFGTIHVLKPDAFPLPSVYDRSLAQCDALWLEVDTAELQDPTLLGQIQQMMMLPAGERLVDQMSPEAYAEIEALADEAGISLTLLQGLKPWAAVNQLTLIIFQKKGFTGEGLDPYLHRQAQALGLPINAFETLMWQLAMFEQLSEQAGDSFVEFSTEDTENVDQLVDDLYRNWQSGDYQTLYRQAGFDDYPQVEAVMLEARNDQWMATLLETPNTGETHCVAVGMLHMAGAHGLIQQFEDAGYRVTQVTE